MEKSDRPPPLESHILSGLEEGLYTISQASEITGVPVSTLRYWYQKGVSKGGTKAPSKERVQGGMVVYLYTEDDLNEIRVRRGLRETRDRTDHAVRREDD